MSKNLQSEYLSRIEQEELPNLWERISSSLPEKNPVLYKETNESETRVTQYKTKTHRIYRWSTVMAASVCLLAMIPLVYQMSFRKKSEEFRTEESAAMKDVQLEEAYETSEEDLLEEEADMLLAEPEMVSATAAESLMYEETYPVLVRILSVYTDEEGIVCIKAELKADHEEAGLREGDVIEIRDDASVGENLKEGGREIELEVLPIQDKKFILKNIK